MAEAADPLFEAAEGRTLIVGGLGPGGESAVTLNIAQSAAPDVVGDAAHLPFASGTFSNVNFEFLPYDAFTEGNIGAISQAADVLQPGGALNITTGINAPIDQIVSAMEDAGFAGITTDSSGGYWLVQGILGW
ncbi:MAG: class I SAM-dependent methyltransferase [Acidobacteria bacterium]|nr:MAG: class I SAM-dependent methyltransferase [Acidobacteriota bacterium]